MKKYGLPYKGSKQKIISKISECFPSAENFYDLFGGGFSVTHFMIENRPDFKNYYFNEIKAPIIDLIKKAIAGKYNEKVFKPEWITREKFHELKNTDAYIGLCWSFGNNGKSYLFGEKNEKLKKPMHDAVVFNSFSDEFVDLFGFNSWSSGCLTLREKRLFLRKIIREKKQRLDLEQLERLQQLQQLERLERLQQLEQLEQLERLEQLRFSALDYREVKIKNNSVVYCDIPYKKTEGYGAEFDHNSFFNWADNQSCPVFISEYNIADSRFGLILEIEHTSYLNATTTNKVKERLYANQAALAIMQKAA